MDSAAFRRIGAAFEGLLIEQCLKPMTAGANTSIESYGMSAVARSIAERDTNGFGAILARQLEQADS